uniref:Tectonic family member 3 n=1 Tax=Sphenodon punctatus TaxID=8508 RepID=A0A8D0HD62_SPHPU
LQAKHTQLLQPFLIAFPDPNPLCHCPLNFGTVTSRDLDTIKDAPPHLGVSPVTDCPSPSPSLPPACLPTCPCDLSPGSCDINCCCDADCAPECDLGGAAGPFAFCLPGSTRAESQVCVEKSLIFRANTPYATGIQYGLDGCVLLFCVGDPIQTYFAASSVLSTLQQPVGIGVSERCVDGNPAAFLESKNTSCTRMLTNLSESCTMDPSLNAASYYSDFTVLKVYSDTKTTAFLFQVKIIPVLQPEAPWMDGNTCHNVVSEVIYEVAFSGIHGIQNVSVEFKVTSVSGTPGTSFRQQFTLHFRVSQSRTPSRTTHRSGNPGYLTGAPVLALHNGTRQHAIGGSFLCLASSIPLGTEKVNCSHIQETVFQALHGVRRPQSLAVTGNADPIQAEEWSSILLQNCNVQANRDSCCLVPTSLEIQVLWAQMGLRSNPQAQVLGARFLYQCESLKQVTELKAVSFTDMTEWPEPPRGWPSMYWKLPFDFFFPFKAALSRGKCCQGPVAGTLLVPLLGILEGLG